MCLFLPFLEAWRGPGVSALQFVDGIDFGPWAQSSMLQRTAFVRSQTAGVSSWRIVLWVFVQYGRSTLTDHREAHQRHVETNYTAVLVLVILIDVSNGAVPCAPHDTSPVLALCHLRSPAYQRFASFSRNSNLAFILAGAQRT